MSHLRSPRLGVLVLLAGFSAMPAAGPFRAELYEDLSAGWRDTLSFEGLTPAMSWDSPAIGAVHVPGKLSPAGLTMYRAKPFALRILGESELAPGEYEFTLRSRTYARFYLDGQLTLQSEPPKPKKLTAEEIAAQEA